ncbi:1,4-alpha-glucan branching enzyme [Calothrix sp. FACHB-156]|nr:1,4-alpha-glucan branching enzyme [Calothrix sp. FACHB-156]
MYEEFGPQVDDNHNVTFKLFLPDNKKDLSQYSKGGLPDIKKIQVTGDFQYHLGQKNWDYTNAPEMKLEDHSKGLLYTFLTPPLHAGFYEYKFYVTFNDGSTRWCNDPCTKYNGKDPNNENSGFVVGGKRINDECLKPISNRLPQKDLIIYEVMIDDFTEKLINKNDTPKARLDLIQDKIKHFKELGINTIEFMPLAAVPGNSHGWGYNPCLFFAVENRFTEIVNQDDSGEEKLNKLSRLQELIKALHTEGIHIILDIVCNHAHKFPYYDLYSDHKNSPYIGQFSADFGGQDLNYENKCTQEFIRDVCKYWLNTYQIDGIRLDFARGFFIRGQSNGLPELITDLRDDFGTDDRKNISLILEYLPEDPKDTYDAINVTNIVNATGCWFEQFMHEVWKFAKDDTVDTKIMRSMDTHRDFKEDKSPIVYIENHDHGTVVNKVGGSQMGEHVRRENWYKTQPCAIALLTLPGAILIHNGQELGDEYFLPETHKPDRVIPRSVNWDKLGDYIGKNLFGLYKKLIEIRTKYPSLRSHNFYPSNYDERDTHFNQLGYGVNVDKKLIIYHRWEIGSDDQLERFIITLNFSAYEQNVDIPFSVNGIWQDLLNDNQTYTVNNYWLRDQKINSYWGRILKYPADCTQSNN